MQTSADASMKPCKLTVRLVSGEEFTIELLARHEATLEEYAMKVGQRGVFWVQGKKLSYFPPAQIESIEWQLLEERESG